MKAIWNACKRPLWYIAAAFVPIFIVGDLCCFKVPQLLNGFDNPFELFYWAFCLNGTIILPWLTYTVWRRLICEPDPETGATPSPFPNFWGGGVIVADLPASC